MSEWVGHRQHRLRLGTISIEVDADGGALHDAQVTKSVARKIAQIGNIPDELLSQWDVFLRGLLITLSIETICRDKKIGFEFTRRRLLTELGKLGMLPLEGGVPKIAPWLKRELLHIEFQRLLRPTWGPTPIKTKAADEFERYWADSNAAGRAADLRVERSLTDVGELRALACDLHREVSARSENTREGDARKRALDPARSCIANEMLRFWTEIAGHALIVTKPLIAMTWAVYEACHFKMKVEAVEKRLHESAKLRRGGNE